MPFNKQGPFVDVPSTTKEGKQRLLSLGYPNAQVLTQEGWTNQSVQLQVSGQGNWTLRCAVFIDEARILMIGGYAGSDNSAWIVNTALPQKHKSMARHTKSPQWCETDCLRGLGVQRQSVIGVFHV